ncbi:hypothetical protein BSPLISOX_290 [uncultured Gammaproteobacteria bacterium]|jgi:hypothetical protein|nr:hypothetical protein BSPLISOX_290 [uncultured Gammaproteobacteria bacterium]
MGGSSNLLIEMQNEQADEWIREKLEDDNSGAESEEYQELATEYSYLQDYLLEQEEFEAELRWLKENGSSIIHKYFLENLDELKKIKEITPATNTHLINKMTYAYAITLLEAFLGDTAKSLISENKIFFTNSMKINELKKDEYSLEFLSKNEVILKGLVIKVLSNILYHNMRNVKRIFKTILGTVIDVDTSELDKIIKVRHDIVHRDGKTKEGDPINLNSNVTIEAISHIEEFSNKLQLLINEKV